MSKKYYLILFITLGTIFVKNILATPTDKNDLRSYVPKNAIIAHRGTTYWAPEETEADLQLSKDNIILALHDSQLIRTTNIKDIYPDRAHDTTNTFTYQELLKLDAGSWFNKKYPSQARKNFQNLEILTLQDMVKIAEGYRIKRDKNNQRVILNNGEFAYIKDEQDNGHRPGLYLEIKKPQLNPGIEQKLKQELTRLGWNIIEQPVNSHQFYLDGKVNVGNTDGKIILQTFSEDNLIKIQDLFKAQIPTTLLIEWYDGKYEHNRPNKELQNKVMFAKKYQVTFLGPSIRQNITHLYYDNSMIRKNNQNVTDWIHTHNLGIHAYSFDTIKQIRDWSTMVDGIFTNRTDLSTEFYHQHHLRVPKSSITNSRKLDLGY